MDFLNPKKKRAHQIRLLIGYGLVGIALAISTIIIVLATYGYDIDRQTGSIIQNGLITIDGHPESADIYLNGNHKGRTNGRLVLPAGHYSIELRRDGYRTWRHDLDLEGGSIEQLAYPFLFPEKLTTRTVQNFSNAPSFISQSPDRRWVVTPVADKTGTFQLLDLNDSRLPSSTINLPADTLTAANGKHTFSAVEWSTDNTHLLIKHTWNAGTEYIMLNRDRPSNSFSVNKLFPGQRISSMVLRDKRPDSYYLLDRAKKTLSSASRDSGNINPVANNVISFKAYEANIILYVSPSPTLKDEVNVRLWEGGRDFVLRSLPVGKKYLLETAGFGNHLYVVAGSSNSGRTYIYKDPLKDLNRKPVVVPQPFRVLVVKGSEYISYSINARFVAVQGGDSFAVYDAETDRQFRYDTKLALSASHRAVWMDGHRLTLVSKNKIVVFDFDGMNQHVLSAASPNYLPLFDRDFKTLLTMVDGKSSSASLQRTELRASTTALN